MFLAKLSIVTGVLVTAMLASPPRVSTERPHTTTTATNTSFVNSCMTKPKPRVGSRLRPSARPARLRNDVVVVAEDVLRVVAPLQLHEPVVVRPVGGADCIVLVVA
jgi:hypothetical protein